MTKVTFLNQPHLVPNPAQEVFNERRLALVPVIADFVSAHPRFEGEVSVTFPGKGVSSVVALLSFGDERLVLKIPLRLDGASGEGLFLKTWAAAGVRVPEVKEEGSVGEYRYTLMSHIDAPTLSTRPAADLFEKRIFLEMGRTLRMMHAPRAEGFGDVVDGRAEFATFDEWLNSPRVRARIDYVRERGLLGEEHGSLEEACDLLATRASEVGSSFCHNDFGSGNIFDTEPITVFDPNPHFSIGFMDLGRTLLIGVSQGGAPEEASALIEGYFGGQPHDELALRASVLLNAYTKFTYWHRSEKKDAIERVRAFLSRA